MTPASGGRYRLFLELTRASLWFERSWRHIWPAAAAAMAFLSVALLDVLPLLPGWLHAIVLIVFSTVLLWSLFAAKRNLSAVPMNSARSRLERDSGLRHRPLTALEDGLAAGGGDAGAEVLWARHRQRMAALAHSLQIRGPEPGAAAHDPRGLRVLPVFLFGIAIIVGWDDPGRRLTAALSPSFVAEADTAAEIDMWITPPAYTGRPPLFVQWPAGPDGVAEDASGVAFSEPAPIEAPAGSAVLVHARGMAEIPVLVLGRDQFVFTGVGGADPDNGHRAEGRLVDGGRIIVQVRREPVAAWPVRVIPDHSPRVTFASPPAATENALLTLVYAAVDDYGVAGVDLVLEAAEGSSDFSGQRQLRVPLPLDDLNARETGGSAAEDLSGHPWAGAPVRAWLEAEDAAGQAGSSDTLVFVLPERAFSHPVAKAVIAQRKRLTPDSQHLHPGISRQLTQIARRPAQFAHDVTVSLALSVAAARLRYQSQPDASETVRQILWETALRIEDGDVPAADRRLRNARQALWEALRNDAEIAEIERLMDDLEQALNEFLASVAAEMARKGVEPAPMSPAGQMMRSEDLREMVETARELARLGARDRASRLLSELSRIVDSLRAGMKPGQSAKDLVAAHRLMSDLNAVGNEQQMLLDQTFSELRQSESNMGEGEASGSETEIGDAAAQEALRHRLGDVMLKFDEMLGGIPADLAGAERAMEAAGRALAEGDGDKAIGHQTEAVRYLRATEDAAAAELARRFGGGPGMFSGDPDEYDSNPGSDPFGRFGSGGSHQGFGTGDVEIPMQSELRRVEQILQELRRRANETKRPRVERDYIDRLLQRF